MPIYTYRCRQCGIVEEHVVSYADRDKAMNHEGPNYWDPPHYKEVCGGVLEREEGIELTHIGKPSYQLKGILASGEKVAGHFGKAAKMRRG